MENQIIKIPNVERILIEDYGIIKKADIKFSQGLNIITGTNASGKTTVIKYLSEEFVKHLSVGEKEVFKIENILDDSTILIYNDGLNSLNNELLIKVLKKLIASKRQVIITLINSRFEEIKKSIKANIIETKNFELNNR